METEDPLSQLADIHLPDAVSLWPPAPGWWLLAALVLLALALLLRRELLRLMQRRREGRALQALDAVLAGWRAAEADTEARNAAGLAFLQGCNSVLKRVALVHWPNGDVANLSGPAWLAFLDQTLGGTDFRQGPGKVLADGPYRPAFDADTTAVHALCSRWIRHSYRQHHGTGHSATTSAADKRREAGA